VRTHEGLATPTRGQGDAAAPITLISPRWTLVFDGQPLIRWSASPQLFRFAVTVRGGNVNWSHVVAGGQTLRYPDDAPRLVPGTQYTVLITADGAGPRPVGEQLPIFEVALPSQVETVNDELRRVRKLGLSADASAIVEARLLATAGFRAAAIERLDTVRAPSAAKYRILGAIYEDIDVAGAAITTYGEALRRSIASRDPDGTAIAAEALASLCVRSTSCDARTTASYLERALATYEGLGAIEASARVQSALDRHRAHARE
jgi:hypothetical protein